MDLWDLMKTVLKCLLFRKAGEETPRHDLTGIGSCHPKPLLRIIRCIMPLEGQKSIDSSRVCARLCEVINQDTEAVASGSSPQLLECARQLNGFLEESENESVLAKERGHRAKVPSKLPHDLTKCVIMFDIWKFGLLGPESRRHVLTRAGSALSGDG